LPVIGWTVLPMITGHLRAIIDTAYSPDRFRKKNRSRIYVV
jgi:hypothetical protein